MSPDEKRSGEEAEEVQSSSSTHMMNHTRYQEGPVAVCSSLCSVLTLVGLGKTNQLWSRGLTLRKLYLIMLYAIAVSKQIP